MDDFKPAKRPAKSLQGLLDATQGTPKPATPVFRTPEAVAAADDIKQPATLVDQPDQDMPHSGHRPNKAGQSWRDKLKLSWPPGRKEWLVAAAALVVIGGGLAVGLLHKPAKLPVVHQVAKAKPKIVKPTTVPSNLTGLPVDPSVNQRPVTAVMIENSLDARPQSGLGQAGVVFEAVAEGGVTRFMALFQDTTPDNVGPIRSARPYYVAWSMGFDAGYAHVGGSPDALADIKSWGVRDLDQFANAGSYHRVSSRAAPHNVYTAIATLNQLETAKGYTTSTYTGFVHKPKEGPVKAITARTMGFTLSGPLYDAYFTYNPVSNSYNRTEDGTSHIDAYTNTQISPKVVIAMITPKGQGALDASGAYYSDYQFIGNGPVFIYQDGGVQIGTWTKKDNASQLTFTDSAGKPIALNPGQTWITAVSDPSKVTTAP